jgi:hypothetical protein
VRELLLTVDSAELSEWLAYYGLEPWGYEMDNWRFGMVAAQVLQPYRKAGTPAFQPEDFMPKEKRPAQTREEQMALLWALALRTGGKVQ